MPTDYELFKLRHTEFKDVQTGGQVADYLAVRFGLSADSIRGRLSTANTLENRLRLADDIGNSGYESSSIARQRDVIKKSQDHFTANQYLHKREDELIGVFISDKHNPNFRRDAWELTLKIINDIPEVHYISVGNDWNDNTGYSLRWQDERRGKDRLFSDDVENLRNLERVDYETLKYLHKDAVLLHIMGNHDKWWYKYQRTNNAQDAEKVIADYMSWLLDLQVLQFSRGYYQNGVRLSEGLVWTHGEYASVNPVTNGKKTVADYTVDGIAANVVYGHTHRPATIPGYAFNMPGVVARNNGCLCKLDDVSYMTKGYSSSWGLGITVCRFNLNDRFTLIEGIDYHEHRGKLFAMYNGSRYEVTLNKD